MAVKIFDEFWYVKRSSRGEEDLAYMTQVDDSSAAFLNKVSTGCNWAGVSNTPKSGTTIKNKPTAGFYIGSSVCRWSTSNKLFRVRDPRGFVVEVPTDNIATLLHLTTVVNGVVQEECVWGRDGANHILVPVNSQPYEDGIRNNKKKTDLLKPSSLKVGDKCTILHHGSSVDCIFLGRTDQVEFTVHKCEIEEHIRPYGNNYTDYHRTDMVLESTVLDVKVKKYAFVMAGEHAYPIIVTKPNVVAINGNEPYTKEVNISEYGLDMDIRNAGEKVYEDQYYTVLYHGSRNSRSVSPRKYSIRSVV